MGEIKREIDILEELEINTFHIIYRSKALVGLEAKYNMKKNGHNNINFKLQDINVQSYTQKT